mmetsp:Transcript_17729/g.45840  ORF Transcript_17729/g.45840 Transcript_17729/m.45840 type:complete len:250 (-) Transcript_17729:382-1131(-)
MFKLDLQAKFLTESLWATKHDVIFSVSMVSVVGAATISMGHNFLASTRQNLENNLPRLLLMCACTSSRHSLPMSGLLRCASRQAQMRAGLVSLHNVSMEAAQMRTARGFLSIKMSPSPSLTGATDERSTCRLQRAGKAGWPLFFSRQRTNSGVPGGTLSQNLVMAARQSCKSIAVLFVRACTGKPEGATKKGLHCSDKLLTVPHKQLRTSPALTEPQNCSMSFLQAAISAFVFVCIQSALFNSTLQSAD